MAKKTRPTEVAEAISQKLADSMGFEHLETSFDKESAGVYLRIHLDKPGGINLNDCEAFHRAVQPLLEAIDYDFLEVCSAGIDRPIKNERDAQKALGSQVEIKLFKPQNGSKEFAGVFKGLEDSAYVLETPAGELRFPKKDVALARRLVDLSVLEEDGTEHKEDESE